MVDPTKGVGPYQNLISGSKVSEADNSRKTNVKETSGPKDEVVLSPKALSASQAEGVSHQVRDALQSYTDVSLSNGSRFDESL